MTKTSAGVLLYRRREATLEVFLVHPGGPFWAARDLGAWTIPKGGPDEGEALLATAIREFSEETGFVAHGHFQELGSIRQAGGKTVYAWALEGDCNPAELRSIDCSIEWPPRSGRQLIIPEIDRGAWFPLDEANQRLLAGQRPLLQRLLSLLEPS